MSYKPFNNLIIILALSSCFAPLIVQGIDTFYCRNGTNPNLYCCPLLAHQISSQYYFGISIILNNKSGYNMTLASAIIENGSWVNNSTINCEPQTGPIEDGQSEAFASFSYQYGMQGLATFNMDDDVSSSFIIFWKAPISYSVYFLSGKKYNVAFRPGLQNTALQVTVNPPLTPRPPRPPRSGPPQPSRVPPPGFPRPGPPRTTWTLPWSSQRQWSSAPPTPWSSAPPTPWSSVPRPVWTAPPRFLQQ